MFTVRLAGNGHGFEVAVSALAMPLNLPNFAATLLRISINTGAQKVILIFKTNIIFGHVTANSVPNLLLCTKFHQKGITRSASRRP